MTALKKIMYQMKAVFIASMILLPLLTFAQVLPPADPAPLDGGLSLLVAAGAAYGIKKYRDKQAE
jgi:hypothetical protein